MFRKKFTKWIPLGNYSFGDSDYVVMIRKNKKTGMLQFKTKKVNGGFLKYSSNFLPKNLIDVQKQWDKITGES